MEISRDTGYFTATVDLSNEHFHFSPFPFYLFRQASLELAEIAMFDLIIPNLSFEIEFHLKFFRDLSLIRRQNSTKFFCISLEIRNSFVSQLAYLVDG